MSGLRSGILTAVLSLAFATSVIQAGEDWIEFTDADAARACGWVSKDGASLEVVKDASMGATALRVQGGPRGHALYRRRSEGCGGSLRGGARRQDRFSM